MKQQEYNIYIKEGCEIKTAQMLDTLGIALASIQKRGDRRHSASSSEPEWDNM